MKQLTCEMCGSTDLMKQDGVFVCQTCGCKYSVEEAKKMMVEGTVEVTGTVKIDQSSTFNNLLQAAQNAIRDGRFTSAYTHCIEALGINPNEPELIAIQGLADLGKEKIVVDIPSSTVNGMQRFFAGLSNSNMDFSAKRTALQNVSKYIAVACKFQYEQLQEEITELQAQKVSFSSGEETAAKFNSVMQALGGNVFTQASANSDLKDIQQRKAHNEKIDSQVYKLRNRKQKVQTFEDTNIRKINSELSRVSQKERNYLQKRKEEYWAAHAAEKQQLDNKKEQLQKELEPYLTELSKKQAQVQQMQTEIKARVIPLEEKDRTLRERIKELENARAGLGIFKGKEKKKITEEISQLTAQRPSYAEITAQRKKLQNEPTPLLDELQNKIKELQKTISTINSQINDIKNEFERDR